MNTASIIEKIDQEIARLQLAKSYLLGTSITKGPGRPKGSAIVSVGRRSGAKPVKRRLSSEGRARIAAAQKARWAKARKATKAAAKKSVSR